MSYLIGYLIYTASRHRFKSISTQSLTGTDVMPIYDKIVVVMTQVVRIGQGRKSICNGVMHSADPKQRPPTPSWGQAITHAHFGIPSRMRKG